MNKKYLRASIFILFGAMLFLFLPLPIKFQNAKGVLDVLWINGLDALRIGGVHSFAIGLITFSSASFLSSKLKFKGKK